jgi:adenylate cyclase
LDPERSQLANCSDKDVLIEFASAVDARCAVEIQRCMAKPNERSTEEKRIEFRIGIHVGNVIIEEDDIFRDGANIAASLEGIVQTWRH